MEKWNKEIKQAQLDLENDAYKKLKKTYQQALKDVQKKSKELQKKINELVAANPDNETLIRSKIYQLNYQKAIKEQLDMAMNVLNDTSTIEEYKEAMYKEGFISQFYAMQMQGVPVLAPINHDLMIEALNYDINNIPLSKRLYDNVNKAKREVLSELSRGIASGMSGVEVARNIQNRMNVSYRKARQLAQNEGHRVNTKAALDGMREAKKKGADIVKQWDCTYDGKTRLEHAELDQQWAEVDDYFEYSGGKVFAPKEFGKAHLDINCRCALLSVPRWDIEDTVQKRDNITGELIEAKNYADWKRKYHSLDLGAKTGGTNGVAEHDEPIFIKTIDYGDKKQVNATLKQYEAEVLGDDIETALIISRKGDVYKCFGTNDRVFPDYDLGADLLKGSTISHYHPEKETMYSFSDDDLKLFMVYNLDVLRGKDKIYTYELTRNDVDIDDAIDDWMNFENFQHSRMIDLAKEYGVGYKRWKN